MSHPQAASAGEDTGTRCGTNTGTPAGVKEGEGRGRGERGRERRGEEGGEEGWREGGREEEGGRIDLDVARIQGLWYPRVECQGYPRVQGLGSRVYDTRSLGSDLGSTLAVAQEQIPAELAHAAPVVGYDALESRVWGLDRFYGLGSRVEGLGSNLAVAQEEVPA
eukprot:2367195-Rhodomonas_salina.1